MEPSDVTPHRIVVEREGRLWRMRLETASGYMLDTTLSSNRGSVWRMAKMSWWQWARRARKER